MLNDFTFFQFSLNTQFKIFFIVKHTLLKMICLNIRYQNDFSITQLQSLLKKKFLPGLLLIILQGTHLCSGTEVGSVLGNTIPCNLTIQILWAPLSTKNTFISSFKKRLLSVLSALKLFSAEYLACVKTTMAAKENLIRVFEMIGIEE